MNDFLIQAGAAADDDLNARELRQHGRLHVTRMRD
jgi:hypothetical protein